MQDTDLAGPTGALSPGAARSRFRDGITVPTSGWCGGYQQANVISVPREFAYDVLLFAQRNPAPVPVLEVTDVGATEAPGSAPGSDLRTDVPGYCVWQDGEIVARVEQATEFWRNDLVTFLYGCSLTFERALSADGTLLRHWQDGTSVPMYDTTVECRSAGRLHGNLVVSMRPIRPEAITRTVQITAAMPHAHGAPVSVGHPQALGIADLGSPDYGEPVPVAEEELPVFWACGVTMQAVARACRLPYAITHQPGHMFITDLPE